MKVMLNCHLFCIYMQEPRPKWNIFLTKKPAKPRSLGLMNETPTHWLVSPSTRSLAMSPYLPGHCSLVPGHLVSVAFKFRLGFRIIALVAWNGVGICAIAIAQIEHYFELWTLDMETRRKALHNNKRYPMQKVRPLNLSHPFLTEKSWKETLQYAKDLTVICNAHTDRGFNVLIYKSMKTLTKQIAFKNKKTSLKCPRFLLRI